MTHHRTSRLAASMATALALAAPLAGSCAGGTEPAAGRTALQQQIDRGRYLVTIGGCNDCHTPGYAASGPVVRWPD